MLLPGIVAHKMIGMEGLAYIWNGYNVFESCLVWVLVSNKMLKI